MKISFYFLFLSMMVSMAQSAYKISRVADTLSNAFFFDPSLRPFYHGVASGDPLEDRVIIWTRVTPAQDQTVFLRYEMATDTAFAHVVQSDTVSTGLSKDYTVKVDVTGLNPGTTYYYRFISFITSNHPDTSLIGRTKTTPSLDANVSHLKFAIVSCANYEGGFFNSYASISKLNDLDAVVHLGDYIYEYKAGGYKNQGLTDETRTNIPAHEILSEADYRIRYALYRLDKDLRLLHQQHPMISVWDDHEVANDAYLEGAENHDPNTEGDWQVRKSAAEKVYFEWMPIRDMGQERVYRTISYGKLMDLIMLDTRLEGREKQPEHFDSPNDGHRVMISATQYDWLMQHLKTATAKWKVIGNQTLFSTFNVGFAASDPTNLDSIRKTEDNFIDDWEGYLLQRDAIIDSIHKNHIDNVVIVTGDSHCSWSFDVTKKAVQYPVAAYMNLPQVNPYNTQTGDGYTALTGKGSYGVEFGGPSISSANFGELFSPAQVAAFEYGMNNPIPPLGNVVYNPHLKYVDLKNHGYFLLDIKADSVQSDYYYAPSILTRSEMPSTWHKGLSVLADSNRITAAALPTAALPKEEQDIPAPQSKQLVTRVADKGMASLLLSLSPNPATDYIMINYGLNMEGTVDIQILTLEGRSVMPLISERQSSGIYQNDFNIAHLPKGTYLLRIKTDTQSIVRKFIKH